MTSALPAGSRDQLARIADLLIPASTGMPSASDVGAHSAGADRVLALRHDLTAPVARMLELPATAAAATPDELRAAGHRSARLFRAPGSRPRAQTLELETLVGPVGGRGPAWRAAAS